MRLHTDVVSETDIAEAAERAGVTVPVLRSHGSKSREHAFEVQLSGSGVQWGQWGNAPGKTATWDEYGMFLAPLYEVDPLIRATGRLGIYESGDHFHWITGDRFRSLRPADTHYRHSWRETGQCVTGSYRVYECKCGALGRALERGYTFDMLSE